MSFLNEIDKVKNKIFLFTVFDFIFLLLPGILFLYLFQKDVFFSLDWIKLVLLSASIVSPIAFLNIIFFLIGIDMDEFDDSDAAFFILFSIGIISTGLILYTLMTICYLIGGTLYKAVIILALIEFIILLDALREKRLAKKQKKK